MSETPPPSRPFRLQRSNLFVPATSPKFFDKAAASDADGIVFDLEDAVAPDQKAKGRLMCVQAINDHDWGEKIVSVRVNACASPWTYVDVIALAENCPRLDVIVLPMTERPEHILFVAQLLDQIEVHRPRAFAVGIDGLIETALGLTNVEAIAACSPRLEALGFGAGDYAGSLHMRNMNIGTPDPNYAVAVPDPARPESATRHLGDIWHYAMSRVVNACRAHGIRPRDGAYADFKNLAGYRNAAERAAAMGFEGKSCIHPSQVAVANEVFAPSPAEVDWAKGILEAMEKSLAEGKGAVAVGGVMLDIANVKLAQQIVSKADRIAARAPAAAAGR